MRKLFFVLQLLIIVYSVKSQTTEFQGTIKLGPLARVYKQIVVHNCNQSYNPPSGASGTSITYETKYTNDKTEITVKDIVTPNGAPPYTVLANKKIKLLLSPNSDGKANLYTDDKDKSVLYVNYWLNATNIVKQGTKINECSPVFDCTGNSTMAIKNTRTLTNDESFDLMKVNVGSPDLTSRWFKVSDQIQVLDAAGNIEYYLVNRYDRNEKYILDLKNREFISYNSLSVDLTAISIPFKYRFGFKKNGIVIKDDVTASFNVGAFGGYKLTRYSIINKGGTYINRNYFSLRLGPFINLSTTTLDSVSTSVGKLPFEKNEKQNIAVLSTGLGFMADIRGIQLGVFGGWDFGVGPESTNWNYHKRFWLGFGLGYKITDLFAKKD